MATILVVDDAAFMRLRLTKILSSAGHHVVEASDGREAVAMYRTERPDAVLLDIAMPEMDGLSALRSIREEDPEACVAMVTALSQQQVVLEAVKSGARDYLVKPCDADRILSTVHKLCA
ncbi:MAG: response regulator [Dehalococcoidia bacterium]|nr:response regulator [Dehalococcoidia bacterium]